MANPNIPNLCGANPNLNESLSKIEELKDKLLSSIDVDASELKADLESGLGDLKAAFDKLEIELPAAPNVNFTPSTGILTILLVPSALKNTCVPPLPLSVNGAGCPAPPPPTAIG